MARTTTSTAPICSESLRAGAIVSRVGDISYLDKFAILEDAVVRALPGQCVGTAGHRSTRCFIGDRGPPIDSTPSMPMRLMAP